MYSVFLSSYTKSRESLGELQKAVETLAYGSCSHSISCSPKLPLVFVQLDRNTVHVFCFLIKGAMLRFAHLKKFSLNFSSSLFVIRVNLLHP